MFSGAASVQKGLVFAFILLLVIVAGGEPAQSKRPNEITFGRQQTLNVFPTQVETADWAGVENVLIQDLTDDALYQDFGAKTAAYVPLKVLLLPQPESLAPAASSSVPAAVGTSSASVLGEDEAAAAVAAEEVVVEEEVPVSESVEPEVESSPIPEAAPMVEPSVEEVVPADPVSFLPLNDSLSAAGFKVATGLFPLAQLSLTSTTEAAAEPIAPLEPTPTIEAPEAVSEPVPPATAEMLPATESAVLSEATTTPAEVLDVEPVEPSLINEILPSAADTATSSAATSTAPELVAGTEVQEITLANFKTAPLEPGQLVNGMQLRLSFAAQLEEPASGTAPYVEVLFGTSEALEVAGIILLEDEVSNALNGGYFLFALPMLDKLEDLADSKVVLRYHGNKDDLDGMFLDAVWLELDTRIVTQDDLKKRGVAEQLQHLQVPTVSSLVSDQINFKRDERPIFNLRYNSQRNFIVREFRNLIGRDLVSVDAVKVRHNAFGLLGITPTLNVTKEGLLTIEIMPEDLVKMRPGSYEIELTLNEGGSEFTDTFDFQWGILTTNPNKSEYQVGETAQISIGALTPNGHTICEANLDLYVTDPDSLVSKREVVSSGLCDGNNVIDVPDFTAAVPVTTSGVYEIYLERLGADGKVLGFTTDTFNATFNQQVSIERDGPTRIYPPATYPMTLTVSTTKSFVGTLTEVVPASFEVYDTAAQITSDGVWQTLVWDLSILGGRTESVGYSFNAPDISPYLFTLGPARLDAAKKVKKPAVTASSTASSTDSVAAEPSSNIFIEHRRWQIASDAIGSMILFFDGGAIPTGWTCLSCGSGTFYQKFVMGSSTYNATGGTATHTPSVTTSLLASAVATMESGTGGPAIVTHSHTLTPTITGSSNLPEYRQLQVIQYTDAAGEPALIPTGAIAIFDVASSSLPASWNRYAAQDGKYINGENTIGVNAGSNTHAHTVSGTTGGSTGGTAWSRGGGTQTTAATDGHTHTISTTTATVNNEPPYLEVLLAQASADVAPANGIIAMWTEEVDGGWIDISSDPSDPFANRFLKASTTYGATGGAVSHTHADISGAQTSAPSATVAGRIGSSGAGPTHTHSVSFTNFSTESQLPPYLTAVFGKRQGTNPVYDQFSSRWYVNEAAEPPTDPWPDDAVQALDLSERAPITAASTPVKYGDEVRLRINVEVTNATSTAGATFKLQYAAADTCSAAGGWTDVGDTASTTLWRGYNNGGVSDHATLSAQLLGSTTVSATYEENGYATSTPNDINVNDYGEWDFVLQHNGAAAGTNYCFRMIEEDGTTFLSYSHYPQLYTNEAPTVSALQKPFDNEKVASSTPWFYFVATDTEGEKIHYEVEVDNNYSFASPEIQRDTIDDSSLFENQVLFSDKAPFRQGELIQFIPSATLATSTYYWRVRALDPDGSNEWGSWSTVQSFTIDTTLTAAAWHQTTDEQFAVNALTGVETGGDEVALISGSTTGTMVGTAIDFTAGELGTAWDSLTFNNTETAGTLTYQLEYRDETDAWNLISNADLPGNSTGFGTSPVSLLNLDTDVYAEIRVRANFTDASGSPSLQDWTVNWGYRVETPAIAKLFANEQTGTTTPTLQFSTSDPQSDSLTYQVQWSLTSDFAASTTRTSDADAGFSNIAAGGDTDPFDSGADIQFTVQPADALSGTTTYWWRVRAKDTTGDNAYSFWTEPQSFTVIPGTEVSTWFQTTEEQFDTNILSGTVALGTGDVTVATTATEAMIVYGEGTENTPRYRQWNGTTLTSEGSLLSVAAPVKWAVVEAGTTREEFVAVTLGTDADVNAQVFATGVWGDLQELTTSVSNINARGFDVAYETDSGDALVAFCDGDANPSYYVWNGSAWSGPTTITVSETTNCDWIQLAADPSSDEMIMLMRGADGNPYEAQVWDGGTWGNPTTLGSVVESAHEGMSVMYEEASGQAVIVTSDGNPARFRWNRWSGTAWGTAATQGIGDDFEWGQLVRDVGSNDLVLCYQDEDTDAGVVRWTGGAWTGQTELVADATMNAKNDPAFGCVFEDTAGRDGYILTALSTTSQSSYSIWNTSTWSTPAPVNTIGDSATMQLVRTGDAKVLATFFDDPNDTLRFTTWDGAAWSTTTDLETNASVDTTPFGHPYSMAPRNSGSEGTTIVSPGVNFNDGLGPYWDSFSWNETKPGTSEILYHVQYLTATGTWAFIPDADLPDNEAGTSTGPIDLSGLNTTTYNEIRPYAELTCDASSNCPAISDWKIEWAGGITVSGTIQQYDQSANVTSGTVAIAVNGVLQTGKIGAISAGAWSISNVTVFPGDIVTVFVTGATDASEAVGVTRYDGTFDIDGMVLYERHLTLGSNDATTTPLTNADIGLYDFTNTEDVFFDLTGTTLVLCADAGCGDVELYVQSGTYYTPTGRFVTHDFENNGIFAAGAFTHEVNGSWDNNATTTMTGSAVVFAATATTEAIDSTGASSASFNNVTFGTTTGSGVWTLPTVLDVNGGLTVSRGTLARGTSSITVAGALTTGANGFWTGIATTTFDGATAGSWSDQNAVLQNVGYVVIDDAAKTVTLAGNVAAQSITIGANDTLDVSTSHHDITVYGDWLNQNNFLARNGEVFFAATSTGQTITAAGDTFFDLSFTGVGGAWAFTEPTVFVGNNFTVATGTVTLPTATTTIAGSFDATGGSFAHNNGTLYFTSNDTETITFAGDLFANVARNLTFNGGGSWTMTDTNATTTNDVRIQQGTVNFPSGVLAIGGTLTNTAGTFGSSTGTVQFTSSVAEVITVGSASFNTLVFDGTGSWSFADAAVIATGDLLVQQGTVTLPTGTLSLGGSYDNNAAVTAGTGALIFTSVDTGETVAFGASPLYDVIFAGTGGGWTVTEPATTTNNFTLASTSDWMLAAGQVLSVGGVFTNLVGGAATTWTGSTLALEAGDYSLNTKTTAGDSYETLRLAAGARIAMWNSIAAVYDVDAAASLYSQDHNAADGDLYIFGTYIKDDGAEYWSYATDFDGTDLATTSSERQVDVRFAAGASASFGTSTLEVLGASAASTTIASQAASTYTVSVLGGTTTAQYYEFADLGGAGLSLLAGTVVTSLRDGAFTVAGAGGSAITLSSTTIDANPAKQIFNTTFATSSAIAATNVTQTDGVPASFWWFREGSGNLYGETKDNDNGDPGSVRFDDSSLVITLSGTVYSDGGVTPLVGGTCDDVTPVVSVWVDGVFSTSVSCNSLNGTYAAPGVVVIGDPTITVFLDNATGGERGSVITRTPTADITNFDIYANRVIVRNEDTNPLTTANLAVLDASDDADLQFVATTTPSTNLTVLAGNELFVFATSTFAPGGPVTLAGNAAANGYDGTLYLAADAAFVGAGTNLYTIGGRLELAAGATFTAASSTVVMNATTTGKSISAVDGITFFDLTVNGTGGGWNLGADITVLGDMALTAGTLTGTGDITIPTGSLTGNGVLSLGGGTTTIAATNALGGTSAWTFYHLQLGDTFQVGTTTPLFTSTTTVAGTLTIAAAHFLAAGNTRWDLSGAGTVFVEDGTFQEDTSTVRYSGGNASVISTNYYNLDINAGAGSPTYTATGLGIIVDGDLTIGGDANTTFDLNAADLAFASNGDVHIRPNGTLSASDSAILTIAGSYDNDGTLTANGGTITFDGTGASTIAAGGSSFGSVAIAATGDVTVTESATATAAWTLYDANTFTLASGQTLAVGGTFFNAVGGAATTWSGSVLRLFGGNNYSINAATTSDSYATLAVADTTQVRMWNSAAATYAVQSTASLYSQDHSGVDGDLYLWGAYRQTARSDYWSYATDFDGSSLVGSERKVDVYFATSSSVAITGGQLEVRGAAAASTTLQTQNADTYSLLLGGSASTTWQYYEVRDIDSDGLVLTGTPVVVTLSRGDIEVSQTGGTGVTVGGSVISANPAKNFTLNRFALNGAASGFNVTATGTSVSSWRFTNHYGDIDGEADDVDPDGDPGYVAWDDSAASITISGVVYTDEGVTPAGAAICNGLLNSVRIVVAGLTTYNTTCGGGGAYSVSGISYSPGDSIVAFLTALTGEEGVVVTVDPVSNINNFDIYWNRVIVRHESTDSISIADMAVYDSSDDANIPFTAVDAAPDTLTVAADRKLIVWDNKEFAPGGNVTLSNGGVNSYGGDLNLYAGAAWTGQGTELLSIGGNLTLDAGATFAAANGTTTFTTSGAGRTIDVNEEAFNNLAFTGSGSWTVSDATLTATGYYLQTGGTLTLPAATTTVGGSFVNNGGTFAASGGLLVLTGAGASTVTGGGSDFAEVLFSGGDYAFGDTNATATKDVQIVSGDITLPSGTFALGGDFRNTAGTITHNTAELIFTNATAATLLASTSDLYAVTFAGGGAYTFADASVSLLDSLFISSGSVTLASGTTAIGGSFDASGGSFAHATGTLLFNSADGGEFIDAGASDFYNVQIAAPTGGYTITGNATTSNNFSLSAAGNFTLQSGATLTVGGVFLNAVGGANTTWSGATLKLDGANEYSVNTKAAGGDQYQTLVVGAASDVRFWNSAATTTTVAADASVYSQDNAGTDGSLHIFGDFHIATTTEYWSYATDFDGTDLSGGSERAVTVALAAGATTTVDGGVLQLVGASANETTITNQGAGTYRFIVNAGSFNAQYYAYRNLGAAGLVLAGTPTIISLAYGDYELAVDGGTLISLSSTTLNANASLVIPGNRFATTTAITGANVTLTGVTGNAWTYTGHTGNLDGEAFDGDGASACGSVRWSDSSCLLTQQTNYRWRNDDGGLGVPASEWYDPTWNARKRVSVENTDVTTYTDAAVQLFVAYDSDMQADFDDLRFTAADGTTLLSHWVASTTNSTQAEVWVKVPSLTGEAITTLYAYYNNPSATTTSSSTAVFTAADDFEDGDISEYSGETVDFTVDGTFAYGGAYGIDATGNETGRTESGGAYTLGQTISQGETIRFNQYIDAGAGVTDEVCTKFGIQSSGAPSSNYAVCTDLNGTDRLVLVRNAVDTADTAPAVTLSSDTISVTTGWHTIEIDWGTDDAISAVLYDAAGGEVGTVAATDSTYTSGGFGFSFWFQKGGWDNITARPTLTTEPTITFGAEQLDGGATWKAAQDAVGIYDVNDVARLRVAIENTGLDITNQQFLLEYAAKGASPSCEAVSPANYSAVPVQASCGTSPVCMQSSSYLTNGEATFDLLTGVTGDFTAGEARENPSNSTGNLNVNQGEFTELEYAVTPTINVVDEDLCFRVTDNGADYDTYLRVAQMTLKFDPIVSSITLNNGLPISLLPGTTTQVYATGTVSDLNGFSDLVLASSTIYRSGVAGGAACTADNNNCYISTTASSCAFTDCVGNSCTIACYSDIYFHAEATDAAPYEGEEWQAFVEVEDAAGGYDFGSALGVELATLRAIDVTGAIDYGTLAVTDNTGSYNASTSVFNLGNVAANLEIQGTDLSDGYSSVIPADRQLFATSTFTYLACGATCAQLSSTTPVQIAVDLTKPTTVFPPVEDDVYWGIEIPFGVNSVPHQGINVFTPISP